MTRGLEIRSRGPSKVRVMMHGLSEAVDVRVTRCLDLYGIEFTLAGREQYTECRGIFLIAACWSG